MANDVSVRSYLLGKGHSNDDIGYDQNSGQVQLKNKTTGAYDNFIKPSMNVNGSTFDNVGNLDSSYKMYANSQQQPTQVGQPTQPTQNQANPYMDQYTQMIKDIQTRLAAPQQDVYSTPQYAAAQAQQQRAAQQGIRSAQESLGGAGFGRSTALGEAANRAQNTANEYLTTQMVPQIQQQLAAQRQAEISNQFSLLNPVLSLLNRDDTLKQNDFSNNIAKAGVTGYYQPGQTDIDTINKLMGQNSEAYGAASPEEQQRLHAKNIELAASIGGKDTTGNGDYEYSPMRTLQGQQMDYGQQKDERDFQYNSVQDAIKNGMTQQQIDNQAEQFAQRLGFDYESMDANDKQAWAQIAISQQNANTSSYNASQGVGNDRVNQLYKVWEATGVAPAGLESLGVQPGTPIKDKNSSSSSKVDPKESANNYNTILGDLSADGVTKEQAMQLAQANSPHLTDADYRKLLDTIQKQF